MKYKRNLMTGLLGFALLAAPITAAAKNNDNAQNGSHQARAESHNNASARNNASASRSYSAPARSNDHARNFAPAPRNESRDQHEARPAPVAVDHRDVRVDRNYGNRNDGNRDWREGRDDGDRWNRDRDRDYRNYGDHDDYAEGAPYYVMPYGYSGGACAWAQHLRNVYVHDRNTGHPAAAADLIPQLRNAERNCGGVPYGYNW